MYKNLNVIRRTLFATVMSCLLLSGSVCAWAQEKIKDKVVDAGKNLAGNAGDALVAKEQQKIKAMLRDKGIPFDMVDEDLDGIISPLEMITYNFNKKPEGADNMSLWDQLQVALVFLLTFGWRWIRVKLGMAAGGADHADKKPKLGGPDVVQPPV